jgi:hypothetical protein
MAAAFLLIKLAFQNIFTLLSIKSNKDWGNLLKPNLIRLHMPNIFFKVVLIFLYILYPLVNAVSEDRTLLDPSTANVPLIKVQTSYGEITCTLNKSSYQVGDTIWVSLKIESPPDKALLVIDTACGNALDVVFSPDLKMIQINFQFDEYVSLMITPRKLKIPPSDSITFTAYAVIDSLVGTESPQTYSAFCLFVLRLFDDKLANLTKGNNCIVDVDSPLLFSITERRLIPGSLYVHIYRKE